MISAKEMKDSLDVDLKRKCGYCKHWAQGPKCCHCAHPEQENEDYKLYRAWFQGCNLFEDGIHQSRIDYKTTK